MNKTDYTKKINQLDQQIKSLQNIVSRFQRIDVDSTLYELGVDLLDTSIRIVNHSGSTMEDLYRILYSANLEKKINDESENQ